MFFNKKTCDQCNHQYDEMLDYCPNCQKANEAHRDFKVQFPMTFIPVYKEIFLIATGLFGFIIFNLLFSLIFYNTYKADNAYGSMLINLFSYLVFFAFVIGIMFPYWRGLLDRLKTAKPYLVGVAGSFVVILVSIGLNIIVQTIAPGIGEGGNQGQVSSLASMYPVFAFVILGFIGPICEEFAYRVGLFTLLRRVAPWLAYVVSAIVFGLIHFDFTSSDLVTELLYLPNYIWAGLSFAIIYEMGGIGASIIAHVINNLFSIAMILMVPNA